MVGCNKFKLRRIDELDSIGFSFECNNNLMNKSIETPMTILFAFKRVVKSTIYLLDRRVRFS